MGIYTHRLRARDGGRYVPRRKRQKNHKQQDGREEHTEAGGTTRRKYVMLVSDCRPAHKRCLSSFGFCRPFFRVPSAPLESHDGKTYPCTTYSVYCTPIRFCFVDPKLSKTLPYFIAHAHSLTQKHPPESLTPTRTWRTLRTPPPSCSPR